MRYTTGDEYFARKVGAIANNVCLITLRRVLFAGAAAVFVRGDVTCTVHV